MSNTALALIEKPNAIELYSQTGGLVLRFHGSTPITRPR
jgi:hypothetical protein